MATTKSTASVIAEAIRIINRKRKPLLKIVNSGHFRQETPREWATVYQLMGLNVMRHQMEEARKRYLLPVIPVEQYPIAR